MRSQHKCGRLTAIQRQYEAVRIPGRLEEAPLRVLAVDQRPKRVCGPQCHGVRNSVHVHDEIHHEIVRHDQAEVVHDGRTDPSRHSQRVRTLRKKWKLIAQLTRDRIIGVSQRIVGRTGETLFEQDTGNRQFRFVQVFTHDDRYHQSPWSNHRAGPNRTGNDLRQSLYEELCDRPVVIGLAECAIAVLVQCDPIGRQDTRPQDHLVRTRPCLRNETHPEGIRIDPLVPCDTHRAAGTREAHQVILRQETPLVHRPVKDEFHRLHRFQHRPTGMGRCYVRASLTFEDQ